MAVSESYLTFVVEQLRDVRNVSSRRLFGGMGLYSDEAFFGIIDNDTLFFKVDAALAPRYRDRGMPAFQPIPGKPPMQGYYQVPPDILEDADALATWARASVEVARRVPPKTRPRRR